MISLIFSSVILAAGRLVAAQPAAPAAVNATTQTGKLAPYAWINGSPFDRTQGGSPCSADNDIMECATNIWKNYTLSPEAELGKRTIELPVKLGPRDLLPDEEEWWLDAKIELAYETKVVSCNLSDPQVISKEPLFFCNIDSCSESFKFTHSTTDVTQYGYSVGASVSASFDVFFASSEVSISGDFHNDWSTSTTTEETVEKVYNMAKGEVCAPTSIQMKVNCRSSLKVTDDTVKLTTQEGLTSDVSIDSVIFRGETIQTIREAVKNDAPVSLDVGSGGTANKPWVIEGCMFR